MNSHDPRLEGLFDNATTGVDVPPSTPTPSVPHASYEAILQSLTQSVNNNASSEGSILLLYSLLHGNKLFTTSLLARSDLDTIVMPLLHRLYLTLDQHNNQQHNNNNNNNNNTNNNSSNHHDDTNHGRGNDASNSSSSSSLSSLYVAVTVLLTFSTDASFCATSFQHIVMSNVPWYKERSLSNISLGSLIVLLTLRLLVHTLSKWKDFYLVETLLAILGNLSPHIFELHTYSAERIVNIAIMSMKNFNQYSLKVSSISTTLNQITPSINSSSASTLAPAAVNTTTSCVEGLSVEQMNESEELTDELSQVLPLATVYGQCSQALVSLIRVATRPHQLRHNGNLTYSLMHKREDLLKVFAPFLKQQPVNKEDQLSVLRNEVFAHASSVSCLLNYFTERISKAAKQPKPSSTSSSSLPTTTISEELDIAVRELSVQEIQMILERACTSYQSKDDYEPLKVAYKEQSEPESFFVNYSWEIVHKYCSDIL